MCFPNDKVQTNFRWYILLHKLTEWGTTFCFPKCWSLEDLEPGLSSFPPLERNLSHPTPGKRIQEQSPWVCTKYLCKRNTSFFLWKVVLCFLFQSLAGWNFTALACDVVYGWGLQITAWGDHIWPIKRFYLLWNLLPKHLCPTASWQARLAKQIFCTFKEQLFCGTEWDPVSCKA